MVCDIKFKTYFFKFHQAAYKEQNELAKSDKNETHHKGIRVTGEYKQLKDDVIHQAIKEAESNLPLDYTDNDNNNFINPGVKGGRGS